jgi:hypothetical protein
MIMILEKETKYTDGIMKVYRKESICSTPVRTVDTLIEFIFVFEPFVIKLNKRISIEIPSEEFLEKELERLNENIKALL